MKKLLILITLLTGIGSVANAFSPVQEAETKEHLEQSVLIVKLSQACKWDERHDFLRGVMKVAYGVAGATSEFDKTSVDMWYQNADIEFDWNNPNSELMEVIKANPKAPDVIAYCQKLYDEGKGTIQKYASY